MQQKLGMYYEYNVFVSYLFERILANYMYDRNFVVHKRTRFVLQ